MKNRIVSIILVFVILFSFSFTLSYRAGAFGDYDGDYDYGGGWDSDWDNDWDDDWNDYNYDYDDNDDDDNYYYGGYHYNGGGSSDGGSPIELSSVVIGLVFIFAVILIAGLFGAISDKKRGKRRSQNNIHTRRPQPPVRASGATPISVESLNSVSDYNKLDPGFSESQFKEKIANLFVQFQNGWQAKNLEPLRPYMSDAYYAQMDRQLDAYRNGHRTKMIERIAVLDVTVVGWRQENNEDEMIVRIKSRFTTYTVDDHTGNILNGSRTAEKFMDYEWSLARSSGKTTVAEGGVKVQNCPNCGAAVNINKTAKCEYCGSIITVDNYDWVVTGIKGISQRTVG